MRSIRELSAGGRGAIDADGSRLLTAALHAACGACAMVRALMAGEARAGFCALRPAGHQGLVTSRVAAHIGHYRAL